MEPPLKRQRLSGDGKANAELQRRRARNDNRLKSIFESIFDKYGRDFEGIGDEVDLMGTGEIVVNNGHLLSMGNERDAGGDIDSLSEESENDSILAEGAGIGDGDCTEEEKTIIPITAQGIATILNPGRTLPSFQENEVSVDGQPYFVTPTQSFETSLRGQLDEYESEEDELADKTIEWTTPREAREITFQKWQLPQGGPTFLDEVARDSAWQAPPLPQSASALSRTVLEHNSPRLKAKKEIIHDTNEPSTSLWASGVKRRRPKRSIQPWSDNRETQDDTPALRTPAHPELTTEAGIAGGLQHSIEPAKSITHASSLLSSSPLAMCEDKLMVKSFETTPTKWTSWWTQEEVDLLCHLKRTTNKSFKALEEYFPGRTATSINFKWTQINHPSCQNRRTDVSNQLDTNILARLTPPRSEGTSTYAGSDDEMTQYQLRSQLQVDCSGLGSDSPIADLENRKENIVDCNDQAGPCASAEIEESVNGDSNERNPAEAHRGPNTSIAISPRQSYKFSDSEDNRVGSQKSRAGQLIACVVNPMSKKEEQATQPEPRDDSAKNHSSSSKTNIRESERSNAPMPQRDDVSTIDWNRQLVVRVVISNRRPYQESTSKERSVGKASLAVPNHASKSRLEVPDSQDERTTLKVTETLNSLTGQGSIESTWESPHSLEVPDSQPSISASSIENVVCIDLSRGEGDEPATCKVSDIPTGTEAPHPLPTISDSVAQFVDELSSEAQPSSKQVRLPTRSLPASPRSSPTTRIPKRQRQKHVKSPAKAVVSKLSCVTTAEILDCSEDELSFL